MPILDEGRTCWRVAPASRLAVLVDGAAYYAALVAAWEKAERSILMVGWAFDSRTRLLRSGDPHDGPVELAPLLDHLVRRRPALDVHVLAWDFAMIYALEREPLPLYRLGLRTHGRLHFRLDDRHPLGGSQHQKIVVVDDRVAFVGGIDITAGRWDTPGHAPEDPRRFDPGVGRYGPFHDVQLAIEGEAAAKLGDVVRERWRRAVGRAIRPPRTSGDVWPADLSPDFTDVEVGIARTYPPHDGRPGTKEIEAQHVEAIRAARRSIYIENQYFSASRIADVLAERLSEPQGPEVVMILPDSSGGWLEEATMGLRRSILLERLRAADPHGRLRVLHPHVPGIPDDEFTVHAKLLIVDDDYLKIGSANLSNRSMGLDAECDVSLEARGDAALRDRIGIIRTRLLAEHLDVPPDVFLARQVRSSTLGEAIDSLRGEGRTLVPLDDSGRSADWLAGLLPDTEMLDPEKPVSLEAWLADRVDYTEAAAPFAVTRRLAMTSLVVAGLVAVGPWSGGGDASAQTGLESIRASLADLPMLLPVTTLIAFLASLALVPLSVLGLLYGVLLPPITAALGLALGAAGSVYPGYWLGRVLWRDTVRRLAGRRLNQLSRSLARRGPVDVALLRQASRSAFGVVNLVAGATRVPLGPFMLGTLLGLIPGIVLLVGWTHVALRLALVPAGGLLLGVIGVAALVAASLFRRRLLASRSEQPAG